MPPATIPSRDRLIVALDVPSVDSAESVIAKLGDSVTFYKIGYQLPAAGETSHRGRKKGLHRSQAARHRQHGRPWR
jgi:orotidine-5'-phosphate decarboxylase